MCAHAHTHTLSLPPSLSRSQTHLRFLLLRERAVQDSVSAGRASLVWETQSPLLAKHKEATNKSSTLQPTLTSTRLRDCQLAAHVQRAKVKQNNYM